MTDKISDYSPVEPLAHILSEREAGWPYLVLELKRGPEAPGSHEMTDWNDNETSGGPFGHALAGAVTLFDWFNWFKDLPDVIVLEVVDDCEESDGSIYRVDAGPASTEGVAVDGRSVRVYRARA